MRSIKVMGLAALVMLAVKTAVGSTSAPDAKITAGIQDKIYHARVFDHGQVQVTFASGGATLTGRVDNLGSKLDAERAARKA